MSNILSLLLYSAIQTYLPSGGLSAVLQGNEYSVTIGSSVAASTSCQAMCTADSACVAVTHKGSLTTSECHLHSYFILDMATNGAYEVSDSTLRSFIKSQYYTSANNTAAVGSLTRYNFVNGWLHQRYVLSYDSPVSFAPSSPNNLISVLNSDYSSEAIQENSRANYERVAITRPFNVSMAESYTDTQGKLVVDEGPASLHTLNIKTGVYKLFDDTKLYGDAVSVDLAADVRENIPNYSLYECMMSCVELGSQNCQYIVYDYLTITCTQLTYNEASTYSVDKVYSNEVLTLRNQDTIDLPVVDVKLVGTALGSNTTLAMTTCHSNCRSSQSCAGVNFDVMTGTCQQFSSITSYNTTMYGFIGFRVKEAKSETSASEYMSTSLFFSEIAAESALELTASLQEWSAAGAAFTESLELWSVIHSVEVQASEDLRQSLQEWSAVHSQEIYESYLAEAQAQAESTALYLQVQSELTISLEGWSMEHSQEIYESYLARVAIEEEKAAAFTQSREELSASLQAWSADQQELTVSLQGWSAEHSQELYESYLARQEEAAAAYTQTQMDITASLEAYSAEHSLELYESYLASLEAKQSTADFLAAKAELTASLEGWSAAHSDELYQSLQDSIADWSIAQEELTQSLEGWSSLHPIRSQNTMSASSGTISSKVITSNRATSSKISQMDSKIGDEYPIGTSGNVNPTKDSTTNENDNALNSPTTTTLDHEKELASSSLLYITLHNDISNIPQGSSAPAISKIMLSLLFLFI
eukprot:NODE_63_length_26141_cov_1.022656.p1 type:complete len:760 gc:universal NODE_63_length_26141_cov_1.022656:23001-25280(+)